MAKELVNCSYCHSEVSAEFKCTECKAVFHKDCFEENGGCSILGCEGFSEDKPPETTAPKKNNTVTSKEDHKQVSTSKKKKSSASLVITLIFILLPLGYAASYYNLLYPLLPAVYKESDILKANTDGYNNGNTDGYEDGFKKGELEGFEDGFAKGELSGYEEGYDKGENVGIKQGFDSGYDSGYDIGKESGYSSGYSAGNSAGYRRGSKDGCQWVFDSLNYDRVVGYSYSYWSSNRYGNTYIDRSQCG